jgi:hypothetical protein
MNRPKPSSERRNKKGNGKKDAFLLKHIVDCFYCGKKKKQRQIMQISIS